MDLARDALAADTTSVGRALCEAYSDQADAFLAELYQRVVGDRDDVALVALGGYGRRELSLQSDLDVLLLHDGAKDIGEIAEAIWYPVWDTGVKLGHAVRTVKEALELAYDDLDTATALLQLRPIIGSHALAESLASKASDQWVKGAKRFLPTLAARVRERHAKAGEVAFLLEPDLKEGRGGLRDVHSLKWAAEARPMLWDGDDAVLDEAYHVLLDARVELHRRTGRASDVLALQEQDAVAEALGDPDADTMMRRLSAAARTIAFRSDDTWRRIETSLRGPISRFFQQDRVLGPGVSLRDGEVRLHARVMPITASTPLEVVALAAAADAPVHRATLEALEAAPPLPTPWPRSARDALVATLATGRPAIGHFESLDQHGLMAKALPEWEAVRSKPQRNAYHTFTVDRHLSEAAANAAALTNRVSRPDLLLIGTWLHDIGKGFPGDHTEVGMTMVADIARRMGFRTDDVDTLVAMVEHHLLLPDVATRRDLDDPEVIQRVADQLGTLERVQLLHALTVADSKATGPAAWGPWKAELVDTLARRVGHVLGGGQAHELTEQFPGPELLALVSTGERILDANDDTLVVIDDDRPGLFSRVAGVLALNGLGVLDANIATVDGRAVERFTVTSDFGPGFVWDKVIGDLGRALDGELAVRARLAQRAHTYRQLRAPVVAEPQVSFHPDDSSTATVVEVFAPDSIGVLYRITAAIADLDLDLVRARVQTMGDQVVDSFYVVDASGAKVDGARLSEVRLAITHAVADH